MNISIQFIPHDDQRYETVGDWWVDDAGNLQIRVSQTGTDEYDQAIAVHELCEALLCIHAGIDWKAIDAFDTAFERSGKVGEPGMQPDAPYRLQHHFADVIEHAFLHESGITNYAAYEEAIYSLDNGKTDDPNQP